ncbi:hypothetical protein BWI17_13005 [Betaproteobacteria bacterium GR16-43]|nr:hypothetical protein BWI17_13005 [Betaproteobacteria bacterium GR16-43]
MRLDRLISVGVFTAAASAFAAQPGDIVLTPAAGGGVSITDASGNTTRLRVADDGSVTIPGTILKGGLPFLHAFGTANAFLGTSAGNFTMTGANNTGLGSAALLSNTTGHENTAVGGLALVSNTTGEGNTALGYGTLFATTTATNNTAVGFNALRNANGNNNTAVGSEALRANTTGGYNTAIGEATLIRNLSGTSNIAVGAASLNENTVGGSNTAVGLSSMLNNVSGHNNVAVGYFALSDNTSGNFNVAIGNGAGSNITTGSNNVHIASDSPLNDESQTIRIGTAVGQTRAFVAGIRGITTGSANAIPVLIDSNGQLGTLSSSERFKDDIADMGEASDALMNLRPVTFHYKADQDPAGRTLQYGLIAEEVEKVYPGLVAHSPDGRVETVMVQFLPAMLLNEVQKQRQTVDALRSELADLKRQLGLR